MANSLGFYILCPCTFEATWDGEPTSYATLQLLEEELSSLISTETSPGSVTVTPGYIAVTERPGEFLYIKGIPNTGPSTLLCMEAAIEAWWNPSPFSLVFHFNYAATVKMTRGDPIAQMFIYSQVGARTQLIVDNTMPPDFAAWRQRRYRRDYHRDYDYIRGRYPDGRSEATHITSWHPHEGTSNKNTT